MSDESAWRGSSNLTRKLVSARKKNECARKPFLEALLTLDLLRNSLTTDTCERAVCSQQKIWPIGTVISATMLQFPKFAALEYGSGLKRGNCPSQPCIVRGRRTYQSFFFVYVGGHNGKLSRSRFEAMKKKGTPRRGKKWQRTHRHHNIYNEVFLLFFSFQAFPIPSSPFSSL